MEGRFGCQHRPLNRKIAAKPDFPRRSPARLLPLLGPGQARSSRLEGFCRQVQLAAHPIGAGPVSTCLIPQPGRNP